MNNIQNYQMANSSVGFKAKMLDSKIAIENAKREINVYKEHVTAYSKRKANDPKTNQAYNAIIDTYKNAIHELIIKTKLLKNGCSPDKIIQMSQKERLQALTDLGDRAAFRELVKKGHIQI